MKPYAPPTNLKKFTSETMSLLAFIFLCSSFMDADAQNVGIETTTPVMKLHVANNDSAVLLLENTQSLDVNISTGLYFKTGNSSFPYTGALKTIGQNGAEARLGLFTFAAPTPNGLLERLSILNNGNVGINTINPSAMLEVTGDVIINGKISNVSDPSAAQDVATKAYVDVLLEDIAFLKELAGIGTVTDIDSNIYKTIRIGTQYWMAENLRVTRYNDSTTIPRVIDNGSWSALSSPAYCYYNNDSAGYADPYGALYNWFTVADTNSRNICPEGWHVPSNAEWTTLIDYLGGWDVAGGKMKEAGLDHWNAPNTAATNESGFTGLPGGYKPPIVGSNYIGFRGYWWSSTELPSVYAYYCRLLYDSGNAYNGNNLQQTGYSVRCLRD